ncbi:MAG: NfeD family protein [Thalassospira sp.]|nr:NfeD family protein [Thalassospira sp.]
MEELTLVLDAWHWLIAGLLLMAAEMLLPGIFLLWLGAAAVLVSAVVAIVPGIALHQQIVLYAVLAVGAVLRALRFRKQLFTKTDQPQLNERSNNLVGIEITVSEPLTGGIGRVKIGDSWWSARGEDAPVGTKMRVVRVEGATLHLERL